MLEHLYKPLYRNTEVAHTISLNTFIHLLIILPKISDKSIGGTLAGTPPVFSYRRHYFFLFQVFYQREHPLDDCADFTHQQ